MIKSVFALSHLLNLWMSVSFRVVSKRAQVYSPLDRKSLAWGGENGTNTSYPTVSSVHYGISHESVEFFSVYTQPLEECVCQMSTSDKWHINGGRATSQSGLLEDCWGRTKFERRLSLTCIYPLKNVRPKFIASFVFPIQKTGEMQICAGHFIFVRINHCSPRREWIRDHLVCVH